VDLGELGGRIKRRREARGLKQADLAGALRVSPQAISKWERGENAPDIVVLVPLARLLDVSIEWLLGGSPVERETFEAVVLATTMRGFAARAHAAGPQMIAAWINGHHYTVTEAVRHFDGVPVKYVGDGFLAFFSGARMSDRAARAALRARELVGDVNFGVVLHRGPIYLGRIGHPDYASLDILGAPVNAAFLALPHLVDRFPGRVVATRAVIEQLPEDLEARPLESLALTGESSALEVFELAQR
jgi:class 3 adenylate cyclase